MQPRCEDHLIVSLVGVTIRRVIDEKHSHMGKECMCDCSIKDLDADNLCESQCSRRICVAEMKDEVTKDEWLFNFEIISTDRLD